MKTRLFVMVLWAFAALSAQAENTRAQLEQETGKLSATLLYQDWRQHFAEQDFPPGRQRVETEMRKDPSRWGRTAVARKAAEGWFAAELRQEYRKAAGALLLPFAGDLGETTLKNWCAGEDAWFHERMQRLFPKTFEEVRGRLAAEQRSRVFRKCYPAPAELEQYDDARLRTLLQERFRKGAGEELWEENRELLLVDVIDPAIAAGRAMQKRQLELVAKTPLEPTLWDAAEVEKVLRAAVMQELAKHPPEEGAAIFPGTEKAIAGRVAGLLEERVAAAFPEKVMLTEYAAMVEKAPQPHRNPADSFQLVRPPMTAELVREAVSRASVPPERREEALHSPAVQRRAERHFQQKIVPQLQRERDRIAEAQIRREWPELMRDWRPEPEAVEAYSASGMQKIPALKDDPPVEKMLAEAVLRMEKIIRERLTEECLRLEKQHLAVHRQYDAVYAALQEERQEKRASFFSGWFGSGRITLAAVTGTYREKVEAASTPPLFPEVEREIEVRSRAILQLLQENAEREVSPQNRLPQVELDVALHEKSGKYLLRFGDWQREFAPDAPLPAEELVRALSRRISQEKEAAEFTVRLIVADGKIYYRTVAELRRALKEGLGGNVEDRLQP